MLSREVARRLGQLAEEAAAIISREIAEEELVAEVDISGQFCATLKRAIDAFDANLPEQFPRIRLKARQLTSGGEGSEEIRTGADIIFILNIRLRDQEVNKGILVQAKRLAHPATMGTREWNDLNVQCQKLLARTPASFVFMYSGQSIQPFSANAIVSIRRQSLWAAYQYPMAILFQDFALSWVGDRRVSGTRRHNVLALLQDFNATHALVIDVSELDADDTFDFEG